jgi:hypothetical protein
MDTNESFYKVEFGTMLGVVWIKCTIFLGPTRFVIKHYPRFQNQPHQTSSAMNENNQT